MNVVGKVGSLISQGVYSVATPFHPFGGAVDIIVVQQQDGTFRSTPWYVRFGKFQGVLKGAEKMVRISVNGTEVNFHMYLDSSGEAYFVREADLGKEDNDVGTYRLLDHSMSDLGVRHLKDNFESSGSSQIDRCESDLDRRFYDFQDDQSSQDGSVDLSDYGSNRYENLDNEQVSESDTNSEVVLLSVDGHVMTAPISAEEQDTKDVELKTPHVHLGPGEGADFCEGNEGFDSGDGFIDELSLSLDSVQKMNGAVDTEGQNQEISAHGVSITYNEDEVCIQSYSEEAATRIKKEDVFRSCLDIQELARQEASEVSVGEDEPLLTNVEVNETSFETDDVETVQKDTLNCENLGSPDISENQPEKTDVEVEEGQESGPVLVETADEDREGGDSVVECTTREVREAGTTASSEERSQHLSSKFEISLCRNELHPGMGNAAASRAFHAHRVSMEEFQNSMASIVKNENLVIRYREKYLSWEKAAPIVLGLVAFDLDLPVDFEDTILVEQEAAKPTIDVGTAPNTSGRRWRLWPSAFRRVKTLEHQSSTMSNEDIFLDSESFSPIFQSEAGTEQSPRALDQGVRSPHKNLIRTNVPTSEQIASLNLKEGQNVITFSFSTRVLGKQQVDAHIYLWMWNARIVISDVDGTITKSDVLGQFMPLVGKDWTQSGVARLFCAIKENGYQLLFLSARAIVQAYLTRSFLLNLKQDGKALPNGPIVISPDGLFPSLYREIIRRAPHEFKIACLEDIKALFPADYNPFYAGFGNRDTDELSYRKIGIPKGKIFIINPKGEVAISHRIDAKSYTSLHTLVNDMFPPTSLVEQLQEDYNSWNYWKMPLTDIEC